MKYTRMAEIYSPELEKRIRLPIEIGIEELEQTCQLSIEIPAQRYVIDEMSACMGWVGEWQSRFGQMER